MMGKYATVIWICEDVYLSVEHEVLIIQSFFNLPQVAMIYIHVYFKKWKLILCHQFSFPWSNLGYKDVSLKCKNKINSQQSNLGIHLDFSVL